MAETFDVLNVGSGHGGATVAAALHQRGFAGSIAMLGRESHAPYERPPLSKEYLTGERSIDRILIRPAAFWSDQRIDFKPNQLAVAVAATKRLLYLDSGKSPGFGTLIWAAGGTARNLNCQDHDLHGVHTLRSLDDVDRLKSEVSAGRDVVIVGGGYIGLEAAAAFRKVGRKVVLLEMMDRVLARAAGEPLSRFFEQEHRDHGVDMRLGAALPASKVMDRGLRPCEWWTVRWFQQISLSSESGSTRQSNRCSPRVRRAQMVSQSILSARPRCRIYMPSETVHYTKMSLRTANRCGSILCKTPMIRPRSSPRR